MGGRRPEGAWGELLREKTMKKRVNFYVLMMLIMSVLSGCIFWDDGYGRGYEHHHGGGEGRGGYGERR